MAETAVDEGIQGGTEEPQPEAEVSEGVPELDMPEGIFSLLREPKKETPPPQEQPQAAEEDLQPQVKESEEESEFVEEEGSQEGEAEAPPSRLAEADPQFVEDLLAEADKIGGLAREIEAELEAVKVYEATLQEWERFIHKIAPRLEDPQFAQALQILIDQGPQGLLQPSQGYAEESDRWESPEVSSQAAELSQLRQELAEIKQAYSKEAEYRAQEAATQKLQSFMSVLETQHPEIEWTNELRAGILEKAQELGTLRPEILDPAYKGNPLEAAFWAVAGSRVASGLAKQKTRAKQAEINRSAARTAAVQASAPNPPNETKDAVEGLRGLYKRYGMI